MIFLLFQIVFMTSFYIRSRSYFHIQVLKLKYGSNEPLMTLGKKFQSATDNYDMERFCMPTDVAVASNGDFFVSDG